MHAAIAVTSLKCLNIIECFFYSIGSYKTKIANVSIEYGMWYFTYYRLVMFGDQIKNTIEKNLLKWRKKHVHIQFDQRKIFFNETS